MADKVERWEVRKTKERWAEDGFYIEIFTEGGGYIGEFDEEEDANQIVAFHNVALDVSPNPMAVAEGMESLFVICGQIVGAATPEELEEIIRTSLRPTLAAITKPATGDKK